MSHLTGRIETDAPVAVTGTIADSTTVSAPSVRIAWRRVHLAGRVLQLTVSGVIVERLHFILSSRLRWPAESKVYRQFRKFLVDLFFYFDRFVTKSDKQLNYSQFIFISLYF